ncbi:hypothetical protein SeLEV6574_g06022 [Synchytrium endobioticum]|uniref:Uncharacterized protein n=1 Tax=Synchytrium endobioticum TaxID=286115 RepID=A0A507CRA9_9FUNG|nr:hypothetical protein SeLEV6574_g06022 [Synchytrium endobioticum]
MKPNMMKKVIAIVVLQTTVLYYLVSAGACRNGDTTDVAAPVMVRAAAQAVDQNLETTDRLIAQIRSTMQLCDESQQITEMMYALVKEKERSAAFNGIMYALVKEKENLFARLVSADRHVAPDVLERLDNLYAQHGEEPVVFPPIFADLDGALARSNSQSSTSPHLPAAGSSRDVQSR